MSQITLKQAAAWCGGTVDEKYENVVFFGASNDTRTLKPGQLFIALQGARDGHDFIPAAMEKGAAAVLCSRAVGDYPAIYVEDPRIALGDIARQERLRLAVPVVGITGSVGKSTTKEMVAKVLETTCRVGKTPVNHNNDIGMPMAILGMAEDIQVMVLEMGMNHFREMAYLSAIAQPDIAVIVNIGTAHVEFLGSVEGIRKAKLEILEGMNDNGKLLLNGDDAMLTSLPESPRQSVSYFGTTKDCYARAVSIHQESGSVSFQVETKAHSFPVIMPVEGMHYVTDAMAAVTVALNLAVPAENITRALGSFQNISGRQEMICTADYTIIKDCYNAGPESMAAALEVLARKSGRRIAVLGDMLELGVRASAEHYRIGRIAAEKADMVLAYGPNADRIHIGCITGGMKNVNARSFSDQNELINALRRTARPGDVILVKGSRGMHMEQVIDEFLKGKTEITEDK